MSRYSDGRIRIRGLSWECDDVTPLRVFRGLLLVSEGDYFTR
jgi:hypothetical protein